MKVGRLINLMKNGKPAIGATVVLRDPAVGIILANAGIDWVFIDQEHNPSSEIMMQSMIYALKAYEMSVLIRVRENTKGYIKVALDMGQAP